MSVRTSQHGIFVVALVAFAALFWTGFGYAALRYKIYSSPFLSMEPTITTGQPFILVDRFAYRNRGPQRGDIVVFMPPIPVSSPFIKRIIALPGDRLTIRHGVVSVNGQVIAEPYVRNPVVFDLAITAYGLRLDGKRLDPSLAEIPPRSTWTSPDTVPRGCYVMLGDNRRYSEGSHTFGFVCTGLVGPKPTNAVTLIGKVIAPR
jgi:signal peptidase I